jgi:hypothetical protein
MRDQGGRAVFSTILYEPETPTRKEHVEELRCLQVMFKFSTF